MANQAVHKRITNIEELLGRSHAILEERLVRLEGLLLADPARSAEADRAAMWQLLYAAVVRFGISLEPPGVVMMELPQLNIPPSHSLRWDPVPGTSIVRVAVVAQDPAQELTPPDAVPESVLPPDEAARPLETPSDSGGPSGLIIEPQDVPFVTEDEVLEAEMRAAVTEE